MFILIVVTALVVIAGIVVSKVGSGTERLVSAAIVGAWVAMLGGILESRAEEASYEKYGSHIPYAAERIARAVEKKENPGKKVFDILR